MRSRPAILAILAGLLALSAIGAYFLVNGPGPKHRLIATGGNVVSIPDTKLGTSYPADAGGLCIKGGGTATILGVRATSTTDDARITGYSFYRDDPDKKGDTREYGGHTVSIPCTSSDSQVHIMVHVARGDRNLEARTQDYVVRYRLAGAVRVVALDSIAILCPGKLNVVGSEDTCLD